MYEINIFVFKQKFKSIEAEI